MAAKKSAAPAAPAVSGVQPASALPSAEYWVKVEKGSASILKADKRPELETVNGVPVFKIYGAYRTEENAKKAAEYLERRFKAQAPKKGAK